MRGKEQTKSTIFPHLNRLLTYSIRSNSIQFKMNKTSKYFIFEEGIYFAAFLGLIITKV